MQRYLLAAACIARGVAGSGIEVRRRDWYGGIKALP